MLTRPSANAVIALPSTIDHLGIGAASNRLSVPTCRSSNKPLTPNCAVKKRKKIATPAA